MMDVCQSCQDLMCAGCEFEHAPENETGAPRERSSAEPPSEVPMMSDIDTDTMQDIGGACNPAMREEYLLTVSEFAEVARLNPETVRRWCKSRKLRHLRLGGPGGSIRIPSGVLQEYIGGR